jgi:hypothetical protein
VTYTNDPRYIYDLVILSKVVTGQTAWNDPEFVRWMQTLIFYTKKTDWSYEHEWRIIVEYLESDSTPIEYRSFHESELKAVIFGYKADPYFEEDCRTIADESGYSNLMWKKAELGAYGLSYVSA